MRSLDALRARIDGGRKRDRSIRSERDRRRKRLNNQRKNNEHDGESSKSESGSGDGAVASRVFEPPDASRRCVAKTRYPAGGDRAIFGAPESDRGEAAGISVEIARLRDRYIVAGRLAFQGDPAKNEGNGRVEE